MKTHLKGLLVSLLLPPLVGTMACVAFSLIERPTAPFTGEYLLFGIFVYAWAFVLCLIPGAFFYLGFSYLSRRTPINPSRLAPAFGLGALLGSPCGLFIAALVGAKSLPFFLPVGIAAGMITAWLIPYAERPALDA